MIGTGMKGFLACRPGYRGRATLCVLLAHALLSGPALAGDADVIAARATCTAERVCSFSVTLKHADTGWKHYADRYEIVGPDGTVLGTRVLRHPHVHEQPFTRSLAGVEIPLSIERVRIRAHDSVHGQSGRVVEVSIGAAAPGEAGEGDRSR